MLSSHCALSRSENEEVESFDMLRSSRELSSRVDIRVHTRPNPVRRATWWLALWAGVGSLMWLSLNFVQGQNEIYQAGSVSSPHRLFENNCSACHSTWAPLQRLVGFRDDIHSVTNERCETCHRVAEHHANQVPAHKEISCAACHQEHEGSEMLIRPSNRHCIACHSDLKAGHGDTVHSSETFAKRVAQFDDPHGHPDFALTRLMTNDASASNVGEKHPARKVLEHFLRPGENEERWQDRSRIRFNHAAHLKSEYDANGKLIFGLIGKDRKFTDLSKSCEVCHEPDHERRFMKPIRFEQHCRECHPLLFDNDRYPGQSVPHESPDVVRGFLTELYTLQSLTRNESTERETRKTDEAAAPIQPIPGHRDFQRLTKEQAKVVLDEVAKAEVSAQKHRHALFGYEASGGCRYCHQVEPIAETKPTSVAAVSVADWRIVPPNIPDRWLLAGEFHHESHRLLSCTACHSDIGTSKSTGDVNLPSIAVCRACHSERPADWLDGISSATPTATASTMSSKTPSLKELLSQSKHGARFDCVECHRYHDPAKEKLNGRFGEK